jgi:hypothetical protein
MSCMLRRNLATLCTLQHWFGAWLPGSFHLLQFVILRVLPAVLAANTECSVGLCPHAVGTQLCPYLRTKVYTCQISFSSPSFDGLRPLTCSHRELVWDYEYYRMLVGLLGRGDQPVARQPTQDNTKRQTYNLASLGIRTHEPSIRAGIDISYLRLRRHCSQLVLFLLVNYCVVYNY